MGDNITFSIQNPNAQPINSANLFLGEDTTLLFIFEFPSDLGITQLNPGDLFTIIIPDFLLSSALAGNLSDPDWEVQSLTLPSSNDPNYTFVLTPQSSIQVNDNVGITFKKMQGKATGQGEVNTQYNIGGVTLSGSSEKLFVLTAPNGQLKDLNDDVDFTAFVNYDQQLVAHDLVYISPENLQPPIANRIHLNLAFNGHNNLLPNWPPLSPPQFIISFSYGTGSNDLSDALQQGQPGYNPLTSAWSIKGAIDKAESSAWNLPLPNTADTSPQWVVEPSIGNQHLLTHDQSLDVIFDQVISVLPEGVAHLYVQWNNIPGYNAGVKAVALYKQVPQQAKLDFTSPQDGKTIDPNTPVTLNWQAFAAENLKITWDGGFRSKTLQPFTINNPQLIYSGSDNTIVPDSPGAEFFLNANFDENGNGGNQVGPVVIKVQNFPAPTIQQFSGALEKDASGNLSMAFSWLVENLGDEGHFLLNGVQIDGVGFNGFPCTHAIPVLSTVPIEDTFTLVAVNQTNNLTATQTIQASIPDWFVPEIQFSGTVDRDASDNPTLNLSWQVQSVTKESTCLLNGVSYPLDAQGHGSASFPISKTAPLLSQNVLIVQNPGPSKAATKTLKTNYALKQSIGEVAGSQVAALTMAPDENTFWALYRTINPGNNGPYISVDMVLKPFSTNTLKYLGAAQATPLTIMDFQEPYNDYKCRLIPAPDGNSLYILSSANIYCASILDGLTISPKFYGPFLGTGNEYCQGPVIVLPDMSLIFLFGQRNTLNGDGTTGAYYFKPDVSKYPVFNFDISKRKNHIVPSRITPVGSGQPGHAFDFDSLCVMGNTMFVGDYGDNQIWWFDTSNIPNQMSQNYFTGFGNVVLGASRNSRLYWLGGYPNPSLSTLDVSNAVDFNKQEVLLSSMSQFSLVLDMDGTDKTRYRSFVISDDDGFVFLLFKGQLVVMTGAKVPNGASATVLQNTTISDSNANALLVTPDNTRIFIAAGDAIQVWEPVLVDA